MRGHVVRVLDDGDDLDLLPRGDGAHLGVRVWRSTASASTRSCTAASSVSHVPDDEQGSDDFAQRTAAVEALPLGERAGRVRRARTTTCGRGSRAVARRVPDDRSVGQDAAPVRLDALLRRPRARPVADRGRQADPGRPRHRRTASPVVKPSTSVGPAATIVVDTVDEWVSRAARKLVGALDTFGVDPSGRVVLDVGASTGVRPGAAAPRCASRGRGTRRGTRPAATRCVALDERVAVVEGVNARNLTAADYARTRRRPLPRRAWSSATSSFISLRLVLPALGRGRARRRLRAAGQAAVRGRSLRGPRGHRRATRRSGTTH